MRHSIWTPLFPALVALAGVSACGGDSADEENGCGELLPGDLVVTEVFADPEGADDGLEWWEIYNATNAAIDLEGLVLVASDEDGSSPAEFELESGSIGPGEYLVVGNALPATMPDHVDIGYGNELGDLPNQAGRLAVSCGDGTVLDEMIYVEPESNVSRQFDGDLVPDAVANDELDRWCDAELLNPAELYGSPGAANESCGGEDFDACLAGEELRPTRRPEPGDLVISELMPDPAAVPDADGEWFEVVATADVDLIGLQAGKDLDSLQVVVGEGEPFCYSLSAGGRVVFGREVDSALNGDLPDPVFPVTLSLANSGGSLVLADHEGVVVDEASWNSGAAGVAWQLDPGMEDAALNDDPENFCAAVDPYGLGDLGTPAAENATCPISVPPGMCDDEGEVRPIVYPQEGELVVTEFMANPDLSEDADGEWFEITATADVDLNDLGLSRSVDEVESTIEVATCLRLAAGEVALLARNPDPSDNGGLPEPVATFSFALTNSSSGVVLHGENGLVDAITYSSTTPGVASSLSSASTDAVANDDEANFCAALTPYGDGDLGTPGETNPICPAEGDCLEGDTPRPIVEPDVGDLVITEFMANPTVVSDPDGEWFEVRALADFDLNGLELGKNYPDAGALIDSAQCLPVSAGTNLLFARDGDPDVNGGLPTPDALFTVALTNSNSTIYVANANGLLDEVDYSSVDDGASTSLDPDFIDPSDNDDPGNFCPGTTPYGDDTNLGTPAEDNPQCP